MTLASVAKLAFKQSKCDYLVIYDLLHGLRSQEMVRSDSMKT